MLAQAELIQGSGRLAEYGLAGVLILVIVGIMTYLLRFVLETAKADRESWKDQSRQFIHALDKITDRLEEMGVELAEIRKEMKR